MEYLAIVQSTMYRSLSPFSDRSGTLLSTTTTVLSKCYSIFGDNTSDDILQCRVLVRCVPGVAVNPCEMDTCS
jgi:hypothetical protein